MYRTPNHEPRYKQRGRDRDSRGKARRYEEPKESSEASTSEEDEESTDRCTEDSEDTTESQPERGNSKWKAPGSSIGRSNVFIKPPRTEDYLRAYYANETVQKHDKITQKNFLSPFPSFLIPPIYRGMSPQAYGYPTPHGPEENIRLPSSAKPPRGPINSDSYDEENICTRYPNRGRKLCEKHKAQREMKHFSRNARPERILTCLQDESSQDPSSLMSRNAFEAEVFSRSSSKMEGGRKSRGGFREEKAGEALGKCKDCFQSVESRKRARETEKAVKEPLSDGMRPHEALGGSGSGKVREKLVYIVEEEGKDMTKLETDLFSVNEILTIKKDLLELSEFAKKLKKLKEMKKDAEEGKDSKNACQCKPVAELLRNVNKRIEALEARQEELERGSRKSSLKGDTETESKKTTRPKTLSDSPPKTPVVRKQSALTTVPSFPKPEMIVSRAGFSNNSEIVNELMDIKTQLQKLEKRRTSKEMTTEAAPLGDSNIAKKKDHAIAVYSSKTYILTSENFEKTKGASSAKAEGKAKAYLPTADNPRSRSEQTKENVANWLKTVSPVGKRSENGMTTFLEPEKLPQEFNTDHCADVFNVFESQEPQKNRASEAKMVKPAGTFLEAPMINATKTRASSREPMPRLACKECIMTPDGRLFVKKSGDGSANGVKASSKGIKGMRVRRSASSCSVPSPFLTKERCGRLKKIFHSPAKLIASRSKSTQEVSGSSSVCKEQKTVQNMNVKNLASTSPREKTHKESKNEFVRGRASNRDALKFGRGDDPLSSSTFSELIRTVNLDSAKPSDSIDGRGNNDGRNMHVYSLATMAKLNFKAFETRGKDDSYARERARERRRREAEEAAKEAAKLEFQKPGFSKRDEICVLNEAKKNEKLEVCECACCCKKKPPSNKEEESGNETCSSVDSDVGSRDRRKCNRRRRRSSSEVNFKKTVDREKRKRERKKERLCRMISREIARSKKIGERKKRKKRLSETDCLRSEERPKKKRSKECSKKPIKKQSKSRKYCSRLSCKCQRSSPSQSNLPKNRLALADVDPFSLSVPAESPNVLSEPISCESESVLSRDCRDSDQQSVCLKPEAPSKDSIEIYLRRQRRKAEMEKEKLEDSCTFRNVFKNLRRFYPKFSNLQLGNFSGECTIKPSRQKRVAEYSEGDFTTGNFSKGQRFSCQNLRNRRSNHPHFCSSPEHYHDHSNQAGVAKHQHLNDCKCVRVYMQSQTRQNWPGVAPPRKSEDEVSSAVSVESGKTFKRDFIFPGRLLNSQYVGHCKEKRACGPCGACGACGTCGTCKRGKKCKKKKHHRKRKNKNRCVCAKCGNVHKIKKRKRSKVRCDDGGGSKKFECKCKCKEVEFAKPTSETHIPIFSFLRHFCKSKPSPLEKSRSKISGIRQLRPSKSKKKHCKFSASKIHSNCSCNFAPKINEIEERLTVLERAHLDEHLDECCCSKKKRKKKHRKKKDDCCCQSSDAGSEECCEDCKSNAKKEGRMKEKGCCQNEIQAYYYTCPPLNKTTETLEEKETKESFNKTTTTTTATTATTETTATTATTEETESSVPSKNPAGPPERDCKLKGRLSSLQSLLNSFHRHRKAKARTKDSSNIFVIKEPDLSECYGKRCPTRGRVVPEVRAESSGFMEKIRKLKGRKCSKKKEESDEKEKQENRGKRRR